MKTNPFTYLLIIALVSIGWYGWHVVPLYYDNLECGEAVQQGLNVAMINSLALGHDNALNRMNTAIGWHFEVDEETGAESVAAGLGLPAEALSLEQEGKVLSAHLAYDRTIQFKPFQRRKSYHFTVDKKVNLQ